METVIAGVATDTTIMTFSIELSSGRFEMTLENDGVNGWEVGNAIFTDDVETHILEVTQTTKVLVDGITEMPWDEPCEEFKGAPLEYCVTCGWNEEQHGEFPCCADWCGLHVDHDGPCKEH